MLASVVFKKTRLAVTFSIPSSCLFCSPKKFSGTKILFTLSLKPTILARYCLSPLCPWQRKNIDTEEAVFSDICGKSQLGANTLYISKKSVEKIIGTISSPSFQIKFAGTVSINLSFNASTKISVLKGIRLPAPAVTLKAFAFKGAASSIKGWAFKSCISASLKRLSLPIFSFVIVLVMDIKSAPFLRVFLSLINWFILLYICTELSNSNTPTPSPM